MKNTRQTIERVLSLIALAATAYIAVHKLYAEVKPKTKPAPGREQLVYKTFPAPRPTPRSGHWPCFILAILLVLISTGGMLDLVLLLR